MVFWSGFIKKIKQVISRKEFDVLKNKVDTNTSSINATNTNLRDNYYTSKITQTKLDEKVNYSNLNNYYTKNQADNKFGLLSMQQTNSTNIVSLNNTKADKTSLQDLTNVVDTKADKIYVDEKDAELGRTIVEQGLKYAKLATNNNFTGENNFTTITTNTTPQRSNDITNKLYVDTTVRDNSTIVRKKQINLSSFGIKANYSTGVMRYWCYNYDLHNLQGIGTDRVISIAFIITGGTRPESCLISPKWYGNGWIEISILNTYQSSDTPIFGHAIVYYI